MSLDPANHGYGCGKLRKWSNITANARKPCLSILFLINEIYNAGGTFPKELKDMTSQTCKCFMSKMFG